MNDTTCANPIRFAPLIRVSTEQQEKKGESLRTQKEQIQSYVRNLGGIIPDSCWEYSGQEHATPDQERNKLKRMLEDSSKGVFDAVIVCDASRWSRDNSESKRGLKILRGNDIRFFVAGTEFDLHSPEQSLFLGLAAEINEFHAKQQNLKSIQNRIARAKRGIPATGKLPYGRTFDKVTETWGLDAQKAQNIQWAADQYLSGKSIIDIAKTLEMNVSNFWKILTQRSGDRWEIEFNPVSMNINETVTITIPRLLPEETIQAIHEKAAANKTYTHGEIKHKYLLSRTIFCAECGNAMFGQTNHPSHGSRRYYRHPRGRKYPCDTSLWVRADRLEKAVLQQLFNVFGNVDAMEKALERAIPNPVEIDGLRNRLNAFEEKLATVRKEKQNIIRSIAKGILTDDEAAKNVSEIRERETLLQNEIDQITPQLERIPSKRIIERRARFIANVLRQVYRAKDALGEMTYENKRELITRTFAGKDAEGKRLGVYVRKSNDPDRPWEFTIRGILGELIGEYPLEKWGDEESEGGAPSSAWHCTAAAPPGCRFPPDRRPPAA